MKLIELSWPRIAKLAPDTPVVFPIAAIEQHGHHLPIWTDSLLLGEVMERVERRMSDRILVAPLQWLGNSHHHLDFAGTLSASPRTYLDLLADLVENMLQHGFRRIIFVNGHGGNDIPCKQAIFEVRQKMRHRSDCLLAMTTYWGLGTEPWRIDPTIHQRQMGHACEWETSMVMRLKPELVAKVEGLSVVEPGEPFTPGTRAWITKDRTEPGHIGWPHLATPEKGEVLLSAFSEDVERWLQRIVQWDGQSWDG